MYELMKINIIANQYHLNLNVKKSIENKDKRMIVLYAVLISLWPMLGKEHRLFYTRHLNNNGR